MKKRLIIPVLIAATAFILGSATLQDKKAQFVQFNNFTANFEVPAGKTWVIHQVFSSFSSELKTNTDGTKTAVPVRIFIKTLNGDIKTDFAGNRFGPQLFQSTNSAATVAYPLTLPEKTTFSLVIVKGDPGSCSAFDGTGYMSFYEVTNN
jgi:hypothetical protein